MTEVGRRDLSGCACVVARGADRADFLDRMATNDLAALAAGRAVPAFFLERTGRVVDRAVVAEAGDAIVLLGSAGRGAALAEWLGRHVIADDVEIADASPVTAQALVAGADASARLAGLGFAAEPWVRWEVRSPAEGDVRAVRVEDAGGEAFRVWAQAERRPSLDALLGDIPRLPESEWLARRVEAGIPEFGAEFTDRSIPLELRQVDHFSFTKGCYVGQEVVARLHNYKRVKRALVRLRVAGEAVPAPGSPLFEGDRDVGVVTSAARRNDTVFALGFVESGREDPPRRLALREGGQSHDAEVLPLTLPGESK